MTQNNLSKETFRKKKTQRGFAYRNFVDCKGVKCSIQESSSAEEPRIWLGADDIGLKHFKAYEGWKDVELIDTIAGHYVANNRMELNRKQVKKLLPILQHFVETGELL